MSVAAVSRSMTTDHRVWWMKGGCVVIGVLQKVFVVLCVGLGAMGCKAIDDTIDCSQVCSAYADCFDSDLDVGACTDTCEDNASESENFDDMLEECEACIEGRDCVESTISCTDDCIGVVPL